MNKIVKHLVELGVTDIYFGSGARNSSLIESFKNFKQTYYLDERVASFAALGFAKSTRKPIAICTTSGTAVAECFPAIIEAYYSDLPIIVISADRPSRLRNSHAPQTINQENIFGQYARTSFSGGGESYTQNVIEFPFHINLEIENGSYQREIKEVQAISVNEVTTYINNSSRTIAIFTESNKSYLQEIQILDKLNIPFYIECNSDLKTYKSSNRIQFEKTLISLISETQLVLKFGKTPFSKLWRLLDDQYIDINVLSYQNEKTGLSRGYVFNELGSDLTAKPPFKFEEADLTKLIKILPESEASIYNGISNQLGKDDIVFIGNSMPIRYWQMINLGAQKVMASRGANGIDGQVATAIGIAKSTKEKVHCIVGDLTFLYDISSVIGSIPKNLIIHIINNNGGRIFEQINVNSKMILQHNLKIKEIIQGFSAKNQINEYFTSPEQTKLFWKKWNSNQ